MAIGANLNSEFQLRRTVTREVIEIDLFDFASGEAAPGVAASIGRERGQIVVAIGTDVSYSPLTTRP